MNDKHYNQNFRFKTQKALEIINHHEQIQSQYLLSLNKLKQQIGVKTYCKMLRQGDWTKMQLLKGSSELYEIINSNIKNQWSPSLQEVFLNLKIIIKNFTGAAIHLTFSSRPQIIPLNDCQYKIDGDKIIKIRNYAKTDTRIYLTIHSPKDLTIFKLKYEFQLENKSLRAQSLQSSSLKLIKINAARQIKSSRHIIDDQKEEMFINLKKGNLSPRSIIRDRSDLQTARLKSIERQRQKMLHAKSKKADLEVFKEKNKSFKVLSNQCTNIFKQYQQRVNTLAEKRQKTTKNLTLLLCSTVFLFNVNKRIQKEKQSLQTATKKYKFLKKCASKFMKMLQSIKMIQPRRLPRAIVPVHHHLILTAKVYLKKDTQTARQIVANCLQKTMVAFSLNKAFNKCAIYRRKMRAIQRFWLNRNKAQIIMLEYYVQKQISDLLTKFPKFIVVKQEFFNRNMVPILSWQYLKESSDKIKALFAAYRNKLVVIEDIKRANAQIEQFNKKSLKKHQKEMMEVPATPYLPQCRYFRDLGILKSMVRSWLEIQYRKFAKKLKKQNELSPKTQHK